MKKLNLTILGLSLLFVCNACSQERESIGNFPIIESIEWGKIKVSHNGASHEYNDCKLWSEQSKEWDWSESNTHHNPGIQIEALAAFIHDVDEVVLTRGMQNKLQVPQETITYVENMGKKCHVGETMEMVDLYNRLVREGKKVGGLFHSTC